ncbi:lysophospholipid acyltransferase family protein [Acinetobacter silvestris]|uniref:Lipid A biosynthesis acyltransferase n=1 Tax=Acinetobacter silvestris TaxID=1977882 RepID=A0A1Y3CJQ5_9GAMM|nr:lysophospholipid acyltransferase family protein [Acinetobacter silvestris]OTG67349.1 lipid A biosynthesis acyltransferase [Acinetobacter silvestris]
MYAALKKFALLPLGIIQSIAKAVGTILFITHSSARKTTEINLKSAYPELSTLELKQLSKRSLKSQCMTYAESVKVWGSPPEYALSLIKDIHGAEIFQKALGDNKGVLAAVPHFGTWEIINAWLNLQTSPTIMYKPNKNKDIDRFMLEARQRLNTTLVPTDETGVRAIFKYLKQGGCSVILPDHVPKPSGGIYSPFFGQNTLSSTLLSKLASKTQCTVIGLSCIRRDDLSGFDLHVYELSKDILSKDLQVSVDTLNKEMERMINAAPEQYLWSYKRFRRLADKKNLYTN